MTQSHKKYLNSYSSDSYPTILRVALDFRLNMDHHLCHTGPINLVNVEAVSQPQMASSPHHPTQATTHSIQSASTQSHNKLGLSCCLTFSAWIYKHAHTVGVIHVIIIILRSEMALLKIHLSWTNCVAARSLLQFNLVRTICG